MPEDPNVVPPRKMNFETEGCTLFPSVIDESALDVLRDEFTRLNSESTAGVRNVIARSPIIAALASSERITALLPVTGLKAVRSLLFDKTPRANWPVAWHQDRTITVKERHEVEGYGPWTRKAGIHHVEPPVELLAEMVTLRIHLDDVGSENGPLSVVPGSHRKGKIPPEEVAGIVGESESSIPCQAGDVLKMRPLLLHSSSRAVEPSHRRVIHLEFANPAILDARLSWAEFEGETT